MDITTIGQFLQDSILVIAICVAAAAAGAIALLVVAAHQIADIEIPQDADFFCTLQAVPITVPLALDLLDMAFDIFAAPIAWIILELLGLQALQAITIFEGLIPGTQLIPTMTGAWVIAKIMAKRKQDSELRGALQDYQLSSRAERYRRLRGQRPDLADQYRRRSLPAPGGTNDVIEGEYIEEDDEIARDYRRQEREYRYEEDMDAPLDFMDEDGEF